jgi:phosphate starvation-inducible membrane PsiE
MLALQILQWMYNHLRKKGTILLYFIFHILILFLSDISNNNEADLDQSSEESYIKEKTTISKGKGVKKSSVNKFKLENEYVIFFFFNNFI